MLARLQRFIALSLAAFVLLGAGIGVTWGYPYGVLGVIGLLVVGYVGTLAVEFVFLYRSFADSDPHRPLPRQLAAAWIQESVGTPLIFLWHQPFRSRVEPDSLDAAHASGRRGVVLVHGFVCNRGVWNRWMRRLRAEGVPFAAVDLEPVFGSIDAYTTTIDRAVAAIEAATGLAPIVVAHSMGGLAARAWLARSDAARCHAVVTIASPHRGTWMARHASTRNGREMRIGSEWLASIERLEAASATRAPFVCFWSHCDNIVLPSTSATLPAADNRHLEATPHVQMIHHPAVIDEVLRLAGGPSPSLQSARVSASTPRRT